MATAASFAFLLALFLPTLASYAGVWNEQPYTHGYLIALACAWFVWSEKEVLRQPTPGWRALLLPAAGLSVVWLAAAAADARLVLLGAVPILLFLWTGAVLGRRALLRLAPIAAIFMLAVPVWGVFTRPLQSLTVAVSGAALGLFRIAAEIEGDVIHISAGSFLIGDSCAGLSYFLSGLTIGALYAQTLLTGWRSRLAVVGLAGLLAIVGNWVRVASLIAIGHLQGMDSIFIAEPRPHLVYGWAIFFIGLLVFFPVAGLIARRESADRAPKVAATMAPGASVRSALVATVAVGIGPLLYYALGSLPVRDVPPPALGEAPTQWYALDAPQDRPYGWTPAFVGVDEHLSTSWTDGANRVLVDRLVYRDQEQGAELIGYTSRIAPEDGVLAERLIGMVGRERRLVNEAVVNDQGSSSPVLVWYWYRVGGIETASPARAKLLEVWAFVRRSRVSELIAVSAPCAPDDCGEASRSLSEFLGTT